MPFKQNEDINLIKATHPDMTLINLKLAIKECTQLESQGLIEPIKLEWACQAFYVNKRSEHARGKKRSVINYQTLNCFLRDDKFSLPKFFSLFTFLSGAKIFSKFDLKVGFWQLGIKKEDLSSDIIDYLNKIEELSKIDNPIILYNQILTNIELFKKVDFSK